jgi:hypothetical protein
MYIKMKTKRDPMQKVEVMARAWIRHVDVMLISIALLHLRKVRARINKSVHIYSTLDVNIVNVCKLVYTIGIDLQVPIQLPIGQGMEV